MLRGAWRPVWTILGTSLAAAVVCAASSAAQEKGLDTPQSSARGEAHGSLLDEVYRSTRPRSRGGASGMFSQQDLYDLFASRDGGIDVFVELKPGSGETVTSDLGFLGSRRFGDTLVGRIPVDRLRDLEEHESVARARTLSRIDGPGDITTPLAEAGRGRSRGSATEFDRQDLTGKGVIVAVLDSGIDWRHPDFRNPDGTTRLLYFYDMWDTSYFDSGGEVGSEPPVEHEVGGVPRGTLYSSEQIDAALREDSELGLHAVTSDASGHGTAVAGVAAGRDSGSGYQGIAPDADLIVVRIIDGNGAFASSFPTYAALGWVAETARELGRPCVANLSFGATVPPRDATATDSRLLDAICEYYGSSLVVCVAAGNAGQRSMHASGRFGPRRPGQVDWYSDVVELTVRETTPICATFHHQDDWKLLLVDPDDSLGGALEKPTGNGGPPTYGIFLQDAEDGGNVRDVYFSWNESVDPDIVRSVWFEAFKVYQDAEGGRDTIWIQLPKGYYRLHGSSWSESVSSGEFWLDLPSTHAASFGSGVDKSMMIGGPGTSEHAITVGSYSAQDGWAGQDGQRWRVNLELGSLSTFSSPGYTREGRAKPDIVAPGEWIVSPLAPGSEMAQVEATIVDSGRHLAWTGTSAASPYVAGVIALMLEKNPRLSPAEVRGILCRTADADDKTGAVPNLRWGYGRLDPVEALAKTPAASDR